MSFFTYSCPLIGPYGLGVYQSALGPPVARLGEMGREEREMASRKPGGEVVFEDQVASQLRQLALVDRVLGLEAEVARLSISGPAAGGQRAEIERLEAELRAVYASRTWRVGSLALWPLRALRGGPRSGKNA
jgi:hypothetical protein